jgi:hypothetical protein
MIYNLSLIGIIYHISDTKTVFTIFCLAFHTLYISTSYHILSPEASKVLL